MPLQASGRCTCFSSASFHFTSACRIHADPHRRGAFSVSPGPACSPRPGARRSHSGGRVTPPRRRRALGAPRARWGLRAPPARPGRRARRARLARTARACAGCGLPRARYPPLLPPKASSPARYHSYTDVHVDTDIISHLFEELGVFLPAARNQQRDFEYDRRGQIAVGERKIACECMFIWVYILTTVQSLYMRVCVIVVICT
jgi:hypothetical protein